MAARAAVEARCQCAAFDGSTKETGRKAYDACAKAAIQEQNASGLIRRECRKTVTDIFKQSTCGRKVGRDGPRVPCLEVLPGGKLTCAVKPVGKCVSREAEEHF